MKKIAETISRLAGEKMYSFDDGSEVMSDNLGMPVEMRSCSTLEAF